MRVVVLNRGLLERKLKDRADKKKREEKRKKEEEEEESKKRSKGTKQWMGAGWNRRRRWQGRPWGSQGQTLMFDVLSGI